MPDLPANHEPDASGKNRYVPPLPDGYGPVPPDPEEYAADPLAFLKKYHHPGYEEPPVEPVVTPPEPPPAEPPTPVTPEG